MCIPFGDDAMCCWLQTQLRVVEVWRDELAMRLDADPNALTRLEQHYDWLRYEVARLDEEQSDTIRPIRNMSQSRRTG